MLIQAFVQFVLLRQLISLQLLVTTVKFPLDIIYLFPPFLLNRTMTWNPMMPGNVTSGKEKNYFTNFCCQA
jgi:hypothetical protein